MGRKIYTISLTQKGLTVANSLKMAEDAAQGQFEIDKSEWEKQKKRWEDLSALTHVNVLDDHITLHERNFGGSGKDRVVIIYTKLNGRGVMRLWCDTDESYSCWHVEYAWTLPDVQEMVQLQKEKGNMK